MKILTVIPLQKSAFKEELTYFSAQDAPLGSIVSIPLRNKKVLGLVISAENANESKSEIKNMDFNLRKILEVKEASIFTESYLEAILTTSQYFVTTKSATMAYLLPNILREKYDEILASYMTYHKTKTSATILSEPTNQENNIRTEKLLFQASFDDRISHYKTFVRESFANKKSVFIVLPTEHDIKYFEENLKKGIEDFVITLTSSISHKKILSKIKNIVSNEHPILIIGTAPFLSVPREDLQTIILEHESSSSYKTMNRPYLDLRTFVEIYASKSGIKLILADRLLRFETIGRKEIDNLTELRSMSFRTNFEGEIDILSKNKKNFLGEEKFKVINDQNIDEIEQIVSKNKKVFVFSLRKGLATFTICRNCGTEITCDVCVAPLVLYISKDGSRKMFVCNKCKIQKSAEMVCSHCGGWDLVPLGVGTDTVYQELKNKLPKTKIFQLDKKAASGEAEAEKIISEFENTPGSVLVGTEMAFFYLKEKVALSMIASFDSLWSIPNYKMSEKILHIILNMMEKTESKLIIETKNTDDQVLHSIKAGNLNSFIREELLDRKNLGYPPYERFIKVSVLLDKQETTDTRNAFKEVFKDYNPTIFGGFVEKLSGKYTTHMLIKIKPEDWSVPEIKGGGKIKEDLSRKLLAMPNNFSIHVDPEDLL
ncbi:MAG: hypothetical protein M3Q34_00930 [bacterium]|nr:hypothetical protein [bacterium]